MSKLIKGTDGTYTAPATPDSMVTNLVTAALAPLGTDAVDGTTARYIAGFWGVAGVIVGGIFGRKRANNGEKPLLGFIL